MTAMSTRTEGGSRAFKKINSNEYEIQIGSKKQRLAGFSHVSKVLIGQIEEGLIQKEIIVRNNNIECNKKSKQHIKCFRAIKKTNKRKTYKTKCTKLSQQKDKLFNLYLCSLLQPMKK